MDAKKIWWSKSFWLHVLTLAAAVATTISGDQWVADHPEVVKYLLYFVALCGIVLRALTDKPVTIKPDGDGKPPLRLAMVVLVVLSAGVSLAAEPHDALAEVNAVRRARGLRPFLRDGGLARAARNCVKFRADRSWEWHTRNDFAFVPASTMALVPVGRDGWLQIEGGCGASSGGWAACCTFSNWTYAGAASCKGRDGRTYHHIFVR